MTAKTLCIKNAARYPRQEEYDVLALKEGVNVIVGEMNAGKTKWLQMIDFVLGDPDYYRRFGFSLKTARLFGSIYTGTHFMALRLDPGAPERGRLRYPAPFDTLT